MVTLTPRLSWAPDARDAVSLDAFVQRVHQTSDGIENRQALAGAPLTITDVNAKTLREITNARSRLNWTRKLADSARLEIKGGASYNARSQDENHAYQDAAGGLLKDSDIDNPSAERAWSLSGKYHAPFMAGHAVSMGWDGERAWRTESRTQFDQVFGGGQTADNSDEAFDAKLTRLALFAQDEWEISPHWSLYEGLRWESIETRSTGGGVAGIVNRSAVLSPILQSLWKVPETKDQVRLALARTYKAPNTRDLSPRRYLSIDNTPASPDFEGNPDLKPELAWGLDLAYERYLNEGGVLSVSAFARQIRDVIVQELFLDGTDWVSRPANRDRARTFGIELEAKGNVRQWWKEAPAVDLRFNVSRNWSKVDSVPGPNNRLAQQTPLTANLGADWKPAGTAFTLGANAGVITGGPVRLSESQTASVSIRRRLDVYGLWKADANTQWRLSVSNMLHQDQKSEDVHVGATSTLVQRTRTPSPAAVRLALEMKL
jgi:outer membrane receptor for ferrienterochelin and colicins